MALVRTFRLVLCALVLLGLTGCSDETPPPICQIAPDPAPLPPQQVMMKVGQQFTLTVPALPPASCNVVEPTRPTSVTAEIEGPGGEPIEGQIQLGATNTAATLQFTPVRPGPHHILVAFSQVGGLHQFDFQAVVDSSTTAPSFILKRPCSSLERTQQGAWVCDTEVLRGDTVVHSFPGARLAVSGEVIWVVAPTEVQRYVDTGTDLVMTGSSSHPEGPATFLLAEPGELFVLHDKTLARYTFSGGTLTFESSESWPRPLAAVGSPGPYGVILRDGEHLGVVTRESVNFQSVVQVCPYQLVSGRIQRTSGTCTLVTGDTVGFEPRALWTREPPTLVGNRVDQGIIHRWEWSAGRLVAQGSVALGFHLQLTFPPLLNPSNVPVIYAGQFSSFSGALTAVAVWSAERRAILFEHLDAEVEELRASPTFYWGRAAQLTSGGVTKVRLRPQPAFR